jgi:hypothetical protein
LQLLLLRQLLYGDIHDIMNIRHLDQLDGPTRRAKKCVDAKSAPHAKHTAEQSWLNTRAESKACQSIFLKLTKDEKLIDKIWNLPGGTRQFRIYGHKAN